jgi:hypothetical protein
MASDRHAKADGRVRGPGRQPRLCARDQCNGLCLWREANKARRQKPHHRQVSDTGSHSARTRSRVPKRTAEHNFWTFWARPTKRMLSQNGHRTISHSLRSTLTRHRRARSKECAASQGGSERPMPATKKGGNHTDRIRCCNMPSLGQRDAFSQHKHEERWGRG